MQASCTERRARAGRAFRGLVARGRPVPEVQPLGVRLHPQPLQARPAVHAHARHRVGVERCLPPARSAGRRAPRGGRQRPVVPRAAAVRGASGGLLPCTAPRAGPGARTPRGRAAGSGRGRTRKPSSSSSAPATLLSCTRPSAEPLNRRPASSGWNSTWRRPGRAVTPPPRRPAAHARAGGAGGAPA